MSLWFSNRGGFTPGGIGLVVVALSCAVLVRADGTRAPAAAAHAMATSNWVQLAERDPNSLVDTAIQRCNASVHDFTCRLLKQERIDGNLRDPLRLQVSGRQQPFSVLMKVESRKGRIRRALYVEGQRIDHEGRELLLVEPRGLNRLLVSEAEIPIDDPRLAAANRMLIHEFGFSRVLEDFAATNAKAQAAGVLDLTCTGTASVDGRPTIVLARRLPYTNGGGYPAALTLLHLDLEWLVPTALMHYADRDATTLLASYTLTEVQLNRGLGDEAFRF